MLGLHLDGAEAGDVGVGVGGVGPGAGGEVAGWELGEGQVEVAAGGFFEDGL